MKTIITFSLMAISLIACNNTQKQVATTSDTPKALQEDKRESISFSSKEYRNDLVNELYSELLTKDSVLQLLDMQINELQKSKEDSSVAFNKFNGKNQSYFNAAENNLGYIQDSILRNKMKDLVAEQVTKYKSQTSKHNTFLSLIDTQDISLRDWHIALKIVKTLPIIDKYQKDNLPSLQPMEAFSHLQKRAIQQAQTHVEK